MICPQCKAEYRDGFYRCADCDVPLVQPEPKHQGPGELDEDPFCAFWRGEDSRLHAELCSILDEASIPHKTVQRRDHLFNLANYPSFELGVPFSLFEKAEQAIRDAFELDAADSEALLALSMPPLLPENTGRTRKLPPMLSPSDAEAIPGPSTTGDAEQANPQNVTAELWHGDDSGVLEMLAAALNENGIPSRTNHAPEGSTVFVTSADLERAKGILREIVEARTSS